MNVLIISQYFWPENFKVNDIAEGLKKEKFNVTILTTQPSYPNKKLFSKFPNYPKKPSKYKNIKIFRVPSVARKSGYTNLILNYLSFAISASVFGVLNLRKINFDFIFVFQTSPATVLFPALILSKLRKKPLVLWILDLWPETLEAMGIIRNRIILSFFDSIINYAYKESDLILCQSNSIKKIVNKKTRTNKAEFFPSWAEDVFYKKQKGQINKKLYNSKSFKIIFTGNIGKAQELDTVIDAAQILKKRKINIEWFFIGEGSYIGSFRDKVEQNNLVNEIKFLGSFPVDHMPLYYDFSDALLVSLKTSSISRITIPAKLQTYLTAGKPIIGLIDGESKKIIMDSKCGVVVKPGNYRNLAKKVEELYFTSIRKRKKMGLNGKIYSKKYFSKNDLILKLSKIFINIKKNEKKIK